MADNIIEAPSYIDDLIIYEIATKSFTSPNGPESGTFVSLMEKLPYLADLGITGIWLSGHQWCDPSHFYNIWTEYACIRPDRLDPTLGTAADFKQLLVTAHEYGIKVFLDVITHGVMKDSPLVAEHPDWFKGESWGMADFDWYGDVKELDQWWIETWLTYVRDYDVDGFRIDVAHYRNDLWAEIRRQALALGKELIIFNENGPAIRGVIDMVQHGEAVSHNYGINQSSRILNDLAGYLVDRQTRANESYEVKIYYEDGTEQDSRDDLWYQPKRVPELIWNGCSSKTVSNQDDTVSWVEQSAHLRVENIYGDKKIKDIEIKDRQGQFWHSNLDLDHVIEVDFAVKYQQTGNSLALTFPLRMQDGQTLSIQLSCHDAGWDGSPHGIDPYAAKGSRYLMGYTTLLAPAVPVMMAGEEFNCRYRPLPNLTPTLFSKEDIGKGSWMYGSWLDWSQLAEPQQAAMLADTKQLLRLRKAHAALIKPLKMNQIAEHFGKLAYHCAVEVPQPYFYRSADKLLLICGNPHDQLVEMKCSFDTILPADEIWSVKSLFGLENNLVGKVEMLSKHTWKIERDKVRQGGLLVLELSRQ